MSNYDDYNRMKDEKYRRQHEKWAQRRKLNSVTKKLKQNNSSKRNRRRDWKPNEVDDWDELEYDLDERVMPRGERERRRSLEQAARELLAGNGATSETNGEQPAGPQGLVVEVSKGVCRVAIGERTLLCHLRGTLNSEISNFTNPVAVGDRVIVGQNGPDSGVVEAILPRRSLLARPDVFYPHLQQAIVANVDQLLIVAAWREPALWPELIDRYLIAAERNHLTPIICVNKVDLAEDETVLHTALQPYRALDYRIYLTSTLTGQGIEALRQALQQRITVLAGLSGVGKSSLLAAVQPGLQLRVGAVSEASGEGRHTTTQATLIQLNPATAVVDTPGIREFGLSGLSRNELVQFFPEIAAAAPRCRFANCLHRAEPDCAVQAAVEAGRIAASRYHSYCQIHESLPL